MFSMIHLALEILGVAALITVGFTGAHVMIASAITKVSETVKDGMAVKHVLQAIAEFKTNHPEIAALYDKATGSTGATK